MYVCKQVALREHSSSGSCPGPLWLPSTSIARWKVDPAQRDFLRMSADSSVVPSTSKLVEATIRDQKMVSVLLSPGTPNRLNFHGYILVSKSHS